MKFEDEIHSIERQGIISKLDRNTMEQGTISNLNRNTATEWLNSFFIVKKPNGDFRVCLDLTDLNKYVVRQSVTPTFWMKLALSPRMQNTFLSLMQQRASFILQ